VVATVAGAVTGAVAGAVIGRDLPAIRMAFSFSSLFVFPIDSGVATKAAGVVAEPR
jgi:hypothetical protein